MPLSFSLNYSNWHL